MNIAKGVELWEFIVLLYNSNLDIDKKNKILLSVLHSIAYKLQQLQESCGFVHGDLNLGNVFVYGDLNFDQWCQLHAKHFTHHFEQFGLI
jgi:RIO-like serine/threonine protein kinase